MEINHITKSFYDNVVLKDLNFSIRKGHVTALCGENGAGKSTLMNIINGGLKPDQGKIFLKNTPVSFHKPADAIEAGVSFIPQEILFVPELTVAESIFLGKEHKKRGMLDYESMNNESLYYLKILDINNLYPQKKMSELRIGEIQLIEIAKAISHNADLLIMDEPTTALTQMEVNKLFNIISMIKEKGKSIIFISHRMNEIFQISDHILVLRDGRLVLDGFINEVDEKDITNAMLGKELSIKFYSKTYNKSSDIQKGNSLLKLEKLNNKKLNNISFDLKKGEILGIFGLMGSGRTTLLETIFGARKIYSGKISLKNHIIKHITPKFMINNGVGYITEDRKESGLILPQTVLYNTIIISLNMSKKIYINYGFWDSKSIISKSKRILEKFRLHPMDLEKKVLEFSGGNQQKIILGKWMLDKPELLLLDEPTKGIDIGAKEQIYSFIHEYVCKGNSVILISSELPELMLLSDRISVINQGKFVHQQYKDHFDPTKLMIAAS